MSDLAINTAMDAQREIIEEFDFFDDWTGRYQYLIDLGRKLPALADAEMTDTNKVDGCQSQVWIVVTGDAGKLDMRAASDSAIVSGLVALLLRVYSGHSAREILATDPSFINAIGLGKHLSPTRSNGLASMVKTIKAHAERALAQS
ncbi:MAG: SufE family protein [Xanthomonadales bacterium]|nr:SufE family protein [Xanthomonadales bacterium]ODU94875.1 MAG: Fe-S cluster assembly protein SufE [Rhodanobacter sp. SCN 66-43]OJY82862.1 MAG: Fe-S cluster assembly protein SufE [Xanthomonadales bacterium 66-474]